MAHRLVKQLYGLTNKKNAPEQIARRYRRAYHFDVLEPCDPSQPKEHLPRRDDEDDSSEFHHTIMASRNNPIELASFSDTNTKDPAAKVGSAPLEGIGVLTSPPEFHL